MLWGWLFSLESQLLCDNFSWKGGLTEYWHVVLFKASMARKIYLRQGIGVGAFRKIYGGRKSNGVRPSHFAKSSGSIARDCLKQLERLDIVEKDPKG